MFNNIIFDSVNENEISDSESNNSKSGHSESSENKDNNIFGKNSLDLSQIDIKDYLPHRYPFLLVDGIDSIEIEKSIVARKNVSYNEWFFTGHFPDKPVFPGVLMIEALAQAACLLIAIGVGKEELAKHHTFLTGVDGAKFKNLVQPGDILILEAEVEAKKGPFMRFNCRASVGDKDACTATISAAFIPKDKVK